MYTPHPILSESSIILNYWKCLCNGIHSWSKSHFKWKWSLDNLSSVFRLKICSIVNRNMKGCPPPNPRRGGGGDFNPNYPQLTRFPLTDNTNRSGGTCHQICGTFKNIYFVLGTARQRTMLELKDWYTMWCMYIHVCMYFH